MDALLFWALLFKLKRVTKRFLFISASDFFFLWVGGGLFSEVSQFLHISQGNRSDYLLKNLNDWVEVLASEMN